MQAFEGVLVLMLYFGMFSQLPTGCVAQSRCSRSWYASTCAHVPLGHARYLQRVHCVPSPVWLVAVVAALHQLRYQQTHRSCSYVALRTLVLVHAHSL